MTACKKENNTENKIGKSTETTKNKPENTTEKSGAKKRPTSRQAVATIAIVLLLLMYLFTLAAAVLDSSASGTWFRASLFATMALPLLIWIYTWIYGKITGKPTLTAPPSDKDSGHGPDTEEHTAD